MVEMTQDRRERLFVYGTLRRDPRHEMFHLLAKHARYLGEATVPGRLFDLGEYPGMIWPDERNSVLGEIYEVEADHWDDVIHRLDEYEGCGPSDPSPHEYRREVVIARLSDGKAIPAWAYVLNQSPAGMREIQSGDYVSWREGAAH
ncbi:MAG TPA: gamma-glutamylcyclotransferase family protein [Thermoanaerobaculia bacterium]|jgi:gamma-glutamylcyclotransferase (GGCT)/AIG2-like uncharacterized protein YtfP|nr:gamma-glutamylcyclotransferase family protein [Thermoanaerobaculia bacterium]